MERDGLETGGHDISLGSSITALEFCPLSFVVCVCVRSFQVSPFSLIPITFFVLPLILFLRINTSTYPVKGKPDLLGSSQSLRKFANHRTERNKIGKEQNPTENPRIISQLPCLIRRPEEAEQLTRYSVPRSYRFRKTEHLI